jgi:L-asparaginase
MTKPKPALIVHGGIRTGIREKTKRDNLIRVAAAAFDILKHSGAFEAVREAVSQLEDDPLFNAGIGSHIQNDGKIRMSAALMDGKRGKFAGIINIENVKPSPVLKYLIEEENTVLAGKPAADYAISKGLSGDYHPETAERRKEFEKKKSSLTGTVGAVARDDSGIICACTSTGGIGNEIPGRAGDSPTVAGTYASPFAGVSCTGRGEHILNMAAAARIVTRVTDGASLERAARKTIEEAGVFGYRFGFIAIDAFSNLVADQTPDYPVRYVKVHDSDSIQAWF